MPPIVAVGVVLIDVVGSLTKGSVTAGSTFCSVSPPNKRLSPARVLPMAPTVFAVRAKGLYNTLTTSTAVNATDFSTSEIPLIAFFVGTTSALILFFSFYFFFSMFSAK